MKIRNVMIINIAPTILGLLLVWIATKLARNALALVQKIVLLVVLVSSRLKKDVKVLAANKVRFYLLLS